MIYMFLAPGFEEIEAIATLDILRRAEIEVKTVGVGSEYITGAHGITIKSDLTSFFEEDVDAIILPGGMPGTLNLNKADIVNSAIDICLKKNSYIFAICAAPSILGERGLLKGKNAVCYPGFEDKLYGANILSESVCQDGKIISAKGPGSVFDFAFKIVEIFKSKGIANDIKSSMYCI